MQKMQGLSLYWNTQCQSRINLSFEEIIVRFIHLNSLFRFYFKHFRRIYNQKFQQIMPIQ